LFAHGSSTKLVVGTEKIAPFGYYDSDGNPTGLIVEVAKLYATKLGLEVEMIFCPYERCILLGKSGLIDLMIGVSKTKEREEIFDYISPPIIIPKSFHSLYAKNSANLITSIKSLKNKIIGISRSKTSLNLFSDNQINIVTVNSIVDLVTLLKKDRIDAFIYSTAPADTYLSTKGLDQSIIKQPLVIKSKTDSAGFVILSKASEIISLKNEFEA
jgi:polar amino acid transport system substrate-binding protein